MASAFRTCACDRLYRSLSVVLLAPVKQFFPPPKRPLHPSAHLAPGTLFAAICSPLPIRPTRFQVPGSATVFSRRRCRRRIVVVGVVVNAPQSTGSWPFFFQLIDDLLLEFVAA